MRDRSADSPMQLNCCTLHVESATARRWADPDGDADQIHPALILRLRPCMLHHASHALAIAKLEQTRNYSKVDAQRIAS